MIELRIDELAAVLRARLVPSTRSGATPGASPTVTQVMTDSRVPSDGPAIFFALRTPRADGHAHVASAAAAGAVVAVVEDESATDAAAPVLARLVVDDAWSALGRLGRHVADEVGCRVVAVTGSYGKTTVKDLAAAAFGCDRTVAASHGSFNNELGVPLTLLGVTRGVEVLIAEAGARNAGDIDLLGALLRPDIAIVTAVGPVHLETFGDEEGVASEKSRLVAALRSTGTAVLNADDPRVAGMASLAPRAVTVSAAGRAADLSAHDVRIDDAGRVRATVATPWGEVAVALPIPGAHHLTNALLALAAAGVDGVDIVRAAAAMSSARTSPSRAALHRVAGVTVLDDAYNASPPTMLGAIRTLASLPSSGRRWAVLGLMAELGPGAHDEHVAVGRACTDGVDELVVVGDAAEGIAEGAAAGGLGPRIHRVDDHAGAAALLASAVGQGDVVLFKASRVATLDVAAATLLADLGARGGATA